MDNSEGSGSQSDTYSSDNSFDSEEMKEGVHELINREGSIQGGMIAGLRKSELNVPSMPLTMVRGKSEA